MKLSSIPNQKDAFIYMERYVDEGTRTYSAYSQRNETPLAYRPNGDQENFNLVVVRIPSDQVEVIEASPDSRLKEFYVGEREVRFVIHPETWNAEDLPFRGALAAFPRDEPIAASPTASTRTVFSRLPDLPPHFIKLHFPRYISRFNRRLRRLNIINSVLVARELKNIRHKHFACLPDVLGVVFGEGKDSWGYLIREAVATPVLNEGFLIPSFALFGGDLRHPDNPPLLAQLIERSGKDPAVFAVENIMIPVVECWCMVAREHGILLESHAQNTLLEVGSDLLPRRIVHRDFDAWIDFEARKRLGLQIPFLGNGLADFPAQQYYSLIFDHFIGREFFEYVLNVLHRYGVSESKIRRQVKDAFHQFFPESPHIFPARTTFYFADQKPGEHYSFKDMHERPKWR